MRTGAFSHPRKIGSRLDLSLPYVSKSVWQFFCPLVSLKGAQLEWKGVEPERFASSNLVKRGFCAQCGTPLTYEAPDGLAVAIGAFDDPHQIIPSIQYGAEARVSFLDHIQDWPLISTEDDLENATFLNDIISYQHRDAD